MRRILLLLLIPVVAAATISPTSVKISALLTYDGRADVSEYYAFSPSVEQNLVFLSSKIGFRYVTWKYYISDLVPHVCGPNNVKGEDITLVLKKVNDIPTIILTYSCNPSHLKGEDLFSRAYVTDLFSFPVVGGLMVLPDNYSLEVKLPQTARIERIVPDPSERRGNTVVWLGPVKTGERFSITYTVPKVYTAPPVAEETAEYLKDPRVDIVILVIILLVYAGEEKIKKKLSQWVASRSEITKE
jgi:hypothetical protein